MEQFESIRRERRDQNVSIRGLAVRHRVHRRTVRQALGDAVPPARTTAVRSATVPGPHVATIRRWLTEDLDAPGMQRHTARRVWQPLVDAVGVRVAESNACALVAQLRVGVGGDRALVMVPQTHGPAEEAEVDLSPRRGREESRRNHD